MKRIVDELGKLNWGKRAYAAFVLCAAAMVLPAQTLTTLHSFDATDGADPSAALVQAANGYGYGTTNEGGAYKYGTVFKITSSGTLTTLYSFGAQSGDGGNPEAELVLATDGNFYGTTHGGAPGTTGSFGTVFKITPSGTLTTLYDFYNYGGASGAYPIAGLVQATNGDFYGTTFGGGAGPYDGMGTVFQITPSGTLTTLYSFCTQSGCTDGASPNGTLTQATNGDLYGVTGSGGAGNYGTIFKITPSGTLTTLHRFCAQSGACLEGKYPRAGLVQAINGDFYGTTYEGGAYSYGTVFQITPGGTLTTLYSFGSQSGDGSNPEARLIQATDGNFYGTTLAIGVRGAGTVFKITPSGTLTTLYSFCAQGGCTDGSDPYAGLVQATNGDLYGTTFAGGADGFGTIFSLSVGLAPFVETQPTSGEVGAAVNILGSDLTGATGVSFNGTAATFAVVSRTLITATVPTGASTGKVEVTTPGGTLSTRDVNFQVLP